MELVKDFVNNPIALYLLPVALVLVGAILVFTFGFKSAEQPPFDKLTIDDRKQAGKKKKIKEKKTTANGHVATGDAKSEKSPVKDAKRSPTKEPSDVQKPKEKKVENNKQAEKNKKNEAIKNKVFEDVKNKKTFKKSLSEKPVDFDDGNWETVPSKADKKKKADQSPVKKDKKVIKKPEKAAEIEKLVKEVVNKELREKEKEVKVEKPVEEPVPAEEPVVIIEEKKEKKKEKKAKKEVEKPEKPAIEKEVPIQKEIVKPKAENVVKEDVREETPAPPVKEGGVAFDELGDVWTEAKAAKKSKKKARRDN